MLRSIARSLSRHPSLKRVLKYSYQGVMFLFNYHRTTSQCRFPVIRQTDESGGFFGYYDKSPESPDGKHICWHRIVFSEGKKLEAEICVKSRLTNEVKVIGKTVAVNMQMGARLQWIDNENLIFNVYSADSDSYKSLIHHLISGKQRLVEQPVFDVSGKRFISVDFKQLASCESEYGYFAHRSHAGSQPEIILGDLESGSSDVVLSFDRIQELVSIPENSHSIHFNHLMFSPAGSKFLFFIRYTDTKGRHEYLMTHDILTSETTVLNNEMTSHCCWIDDVTVAGYLAYEGVADFYRIDLESLRFSRLFDQAMVHDGHPSYKNGVLIFDSYPDHSRMQQLFVSNSKRVLLAGSFYSPLIFNEFYRCDLHPRFSQDGKRIYFDSLHEKKRHLYAIELTNHE